MIMRIDITNAEEYLKKEFFLDENQSLDRNLTLKDDLAIDSLSLVETIINIEDDFGIEFKDSDLDPSHLITMDDICNLIIKYIDLPEEK